MKCRLLHCVSNELCTCSFEQVPCHICDGQQDVIDLELKMISVTDDFSYSGTPLRHQSHIHVSINQIKYAHGRKKAKVRKKSARATRCGVGYLADWSFQWRSGKPWRCNDLLDRHAPRLSSSNLTCTWHRHQWSLILKMLPVLMDRSSSWSSQSPKSDGV